MVKPRAITDEMKRGDMPDNLVRLCGSFMSNRPNKAGDHVFKVDRGCPQGTSLGPTLWLFALEEWIRRMRDMVERTRKEGMNRLWFQVYADDQVVLLTGTSAREIEHIWDRVQFECSDWASKRGMRYSVNKTQALFKGVGNIRGPLLYFQGNRITYNESIQYLGIQVDRLTNFVAHTAKVRRKAGEVTCKFKGMLGRKLGKDKGWVKTVSEKIIMPAVMYGVEVWGEGLKDSRSIRNIKAAERYSLMAMVKAYKTTSSLECSVKH